MLPIGQIEAMTANPLWDSVNSSSVRTSLFFTPITWSWWSNPQNFSYNSLQLHLFCSSAKIHRDSSFPQTFTPGLHPYSRSHHSQLTDSLLPEWDPTWVLEGAQESLPSCTARKWKNKRLRQTAFPCRASLGHKEHSKALALFQGGPPISLTSLTVSRRLGNL